MEKGNVKGPFLTYKQYFQGEKAFFPVLLLLYCIAGWYWLGGYLSSDLTVIAGLFLLPVFIINKRRHRSVRLLVVVLLFSVLAIAIPVKTTFFLLWVSSFLLLVEAFYGRLAPEAIVLPFVLSPFFKYLISAFSIPLRLELSEIASAIISLVMPAVSKGNLIITGGNEFLVDSGCAGLNMLHASVIAALLFSFLTNNTRKSNLFTLILLLISAVILTILSNLFRIILLVFLQCGPDSYFHQFAGLFSFALIVIGPLYGIAWLINRNRRAQVVTYDNSSCDSRYVFIHIPVILILGTAGILRQETPGNFIAGSVEIQGYTSTLLQHGIVKLQNSESLVYLKPVEWYAAEHNPAVCWSGSGYSLRKISVEQSSGFKYYRGELVKDKDIIHSAWWMLTGNETTINQKKWRMATLKNSTPAWLVNVNAESKEDLEKLVRKFYSLNLSHPLPVKGDHDHHAQHR